MPRQNRRRDAGPARPIGLAGQRRESWAGQPYAVRSIAGANAVKDYRCPGCAQLILPGVPHVVAWPESDGDAAGRRHWHSACWAARERRPPR